MYNHYNPLPVQYNIINPWPRALQVPAATHYQYWIPNEEYGRVIAHQVPITLLGVELDGKPPGVSHGIGTT